MKSTKQYKAISTKLSKREIEVLTWAARGKTFPEIAMLLPIKEDTVKFHIEQAGRKLNTKNKTHTAAVAVALGLINNHHHVTCGLRGSRSQS